MENAIKIALAALFLGCLADMPYGYFQLVRFLGMVGFGALAYWDKEDGRDGLAIFWLLSAVLINPFFKFALGRELWNAVDVAWAVVLAATIFVPAGTRNATHI